MVVLVLMGIASSLVIGQFFAEKSPLSRTTAYLNSSLNAFQEQAIQQEMLFGLVVTRRGWQPVKYCGGNSVGKKDWCKAGTAFELPDSSAFSLNIERQDVRLPERFGEKLLPQLWFFPDGDSTVFRLCVVRRNCQQCLSSSGFMAFEAGEESCEKE